MSSTWKNNPEPTQSHFSAYRTKPSSHNLVHMTHCTYHLVASLSFWCGKFLILTCWWVWVWQGHGWHPTHPWIASPGLLLSIWGPGQSFLPLLGVFVMDSPQLSPSSWTVSSWRAHIQCWSMWGYKDLVLASMWDNSEGPSQLQSSPWDWQSCCQCIALQLPLLSSCASCLFSQVIILREHLIYICTWIFPTTLTQGAWPVTGRSSPGWQQHLSWVAERGWMFTV